MASESQNRANRENAKKSTGPRTAEGKAIARRNATTHSAYSCMAIEELGEDPVELERFREEALAALAPKDAIAAALADEVVAKLWQFRRIRVVARTLSIL